MIKHGKVTGLVSVLGNRRVMSYTRGSTRVSILEELDQSYYDSEEE